MKWSIAIPGAALLAVLTLSAQPVRAQDEGARLADVVRRIHVPNATVMAAYDRAGLLIVGHIQDGAARLSIFTLDGLDAGDDKAPSPTVIDLPRSEALSDYVHVPLALALHPDLPVLYLWRDIRADSEIEPGSDAETQLFQHLDHLLIYRIEGEGDALKLTQAGAFCRGERFAYNQPRASLAVSGDGQRLFIPNLMSPEDLEDRAHQEEDERDETDWGAIGYFDLDPQGMLVPVPIPIEGTLDGYGLNKYDLQIRPRWVHTAGTRSSYRSRRWLKTNPTGDGFFAPNARTLVFGSRSGFGVWDTVDRRQELSEVAVYGLMECALAGHPTLPMLYAAALNEHDLAYIQHVQGFPTLMPKRIVMPGANFQAPPVAFHGKRHGLAIGGENRLHLVGLDDAGKFTGEFQTITAPSGGPLRAVAYSATHDRLYIAVDEMP